ncbi:MAG: hypothetical protein DCF19_00015 [Pseudanabaena frigida]|uniref:Uncharacterized protein n=1 Tax=Pseudanabaena frigida TaxID=945775 RepID=A0A2W4WKF5_9CYAN|nr:MAG: hypothetical protein DCF19_00015 [Pseudanabaena frigida]
MGLRSASNPSWLSEAEACTISIDELQRFALKPQSIKNLKALPRKAFKFFIVVRLIGNCCTNAIDKI